MKLLIDKDIITEALSVDNAYEIIEFSYSYYNHHGYDGKGKATASIEVNNDIEVEVDINELDLVENEYVKNLAETNEMYEETIHKLEKDLNDLQQLYNNLVLDHLNEINKPFLQKLFGGK